MSGTNPFRRKVPPEGDLNYSYTRVSDKATSRSTTLDTNISRPQKAKAKTVRIISPHSSTYEKDAGVEYKFSTPSGSFDASPSDSGSDEIAEKSTLLDPFDIESEDGEATSEDELRQNTRGNTGSTRSNALLRTQMPPNPFRKNLENEREVVRSVVTNDKLAETSAGTSSGGKPLYDVNDFKRLLLTGEKNISHNGAALALVAHDSSSNTDTSSISRQSIFEPLPENHQDTPRTSHEITQSEDERQGSVNEFHGGEARIRPPVPASHHGKPVRGNELQIKFLQDSATYGQRSITGSTVSDLHSKSSPSQSPTDLNKPLPLPPTSAFSERPLTEPDSQILSPHDEKLSRNVSQTQVIDHSPKKSPPAPPLARRHSQMRQKPAVAKFERPVSSIEDKPKEQESYLMALAASSSKLPPPPPPRRHGRVRGLSTSSTGSAISATLATHLSSSADDPSLKSPKIPPPLPPARTPSIKKPPRSVTNSNSPSMAPPPTPPRGRGSSQGSLTSLQTGGEYPVANANRQRNDSEASWTLPAAASAPETEFGKFDVLADLSTLQREVDELRGKFNQ